MGGSSNKAANQANEAEKQRQQAIQATQARINGVFDSPSRAADITSTVDAQRQFLTKNLDQQRSDAARGTKFALARSGLTGGSEQIDQNARLDKTYDQGVLSAEQKAQGVGAALEQSDQDSRARLIQLATSGLDATTAASQSAAALQSNLQASRSTQNANALGDLFSNYNSFAKNARDAQLRRQANQDAGVGLYSQPKSSFGGYGSQ